MYYRVLPCIIVVLHNVNTRASDTPQIRRDTTLIHVFRELSHELCRYISDTSTIRPIHAQYVIDTRIAVGRCRYSSIHGRYAADTQPIRRLYIVTCPLPQAEGAAPPPRHSSLGLLLYQVLG